MEIKDNFGLHSRKCLEVCKTVQKSQSAISMSYNGYPVDVKSILDLMNPCVSACEDIKIETKGVDKSKVLDAILPIIH